jgi:hypothetical protein
LGTDSGGWRRDEIGKSEAKIQPGLTHIRDARKNRTQWR